MKKIVTYPMYTDAMIQMASQHSLIALDLDDVILTPDHNYACGSIWYGRYHAANKHLLSAHEMISAVFKCFNSTGYIPVSSQLNDDFSALSQSKLVMGLTSRAASFAPETQRHLAAVNMTFSFGLAQRDIIMGGVIYAGVDAITARPNNKGEVLSDLLKQGALGAHDSILFIDDSLKNLQDVYAALPNDIEFTGIHFTEVAAKLACEYEYHELDIIGNYQFNRLNEYGYIPSNNEVWGDMCVIDR